MASPGSAMQDKQWDSVAAYASIPDSTAAG
jgi:hypothetical protein